MSQREGLVALTCYCASSISMTIMNKLVLSNHKFGMNFFLLMMQSLVSVIFLRICKSLHLVKYRPLNRKDALSWLPVSLLLIAMIYTGSKSLQFLTVSMFTVFKNITIMFIALAERHFFYTRITPLMWCSFALIIASSVIGGFNDLTFNVAGYLWMTINCTISASYILFMRSVIKKVQFADFDSVYYSNTLAVPILLILSLLLENWPRFIADYFLSTSPLASERNSLLFGIIFSSISAFAISYSTAWSVRVVSSTTYSMVGALNKLPIAISGFLFFSQERSVTTIWNFVSILVAFASGIVYSVAQIRVRNHAATTVLPSALKSINEEETILLRNIKA